MFLHVIYTFVTIQYIGTITKAAMLPRLLIKYWCLCALVNIETFFIIVIIENFRILLYIIQRIKTLVNRAIIEQETCMSLCIIAV